jgi:CelD/BcsL family acetyltransferase involved in cellulose biosynthesis
VTEPDESPGPPAPLITSEALDRLTPEWLELHAAVPGATPFTHPAWAATWLRHFGEGIEPIFLSIREGDALTGVVALDGSHGASSLLGDHNVADYGPVLALPGHEPQVAAGVLEWLLEDLTPAFTAWGLRANSPWPAAFASGAERFGWRLEEEEEAVCPVAELPASFEEFVAGLPKHDRHELRRKLRHLHEGHVVEFSSETSEQGIAARIPALFEMMRASRHDKEVFLTPRMEAFFSDLSAAFAGLGMARLSTLTVDGAPAAMALGFENAGTSFLYNSGYEPAFAPLAVGLLSKACAIEDAIGRGKRTFDFLRGDEDYKRHLGGLPWDVVRLRLTR